MDEKIPKDVQNIFAAGISYDLVDEGEDYFGMETNHEYN